MSRIKQLYLSVLPSVIVILTSAPVGTASWLALLSPSVSLLYYTVVVIMLVLNVFFSYARKNGLNYRVLLLADTEKWKHKYHSTVFHLFYRTSQLNLKISVLKFKLLIV